MGVPAALLRGYRVSGRSRSREAIREWNPKTSVVRQIGGGFSLIELIIAIAILVILTGLLAPNILRYVEKARQAKDLQALDTLREEITLAIIDGDIHVPDVCYQLNTSAVTSHGDFTRYKEEYNWFVSKFKSIKFVSKELNSHRNEAPCIRVIIKNGTVKVSVGPGWESTGTFKMQDGTPFLVPFDGSYNWQ